MGMAITPASPRQTRLRDERRSLPDGPGVYLFRDERGRVIYVGKAKSIRKRVAGHFANPVTRGAVEMVSLIHEIDFLLVSSEAEALLTENRFIKAIITGTWRPTLPGKWRRPRYPGEPPFPRVFGGLPAGCAAGLRGKGRRRNRGMKVLSGRAGGALGDRPAWSKRGLQVICELGVETPNRREGQLGRPAGEQLLVGGFTGGDLSVARRRRKIGR